MAAPQQFSLRWNNYSHHIVTAFDVLREDEELTDVTLSCEGQRIRAHKILLSACSVYFKETFSENPCKHPVVILKGVAFQDLQAVITFMYNGQVNVTQDRLNSFLQTAELLEIKGLTDINDKDDAFKKRTLPSSGKTNESNSAEIIQRPPTPKRKKMSGIQSHSNDSSSYGNSNFGSISSVGIQGPSASNGQSSSSGLINQPNLLPPTTSAAVQQESENFANVLVKFEEEDEEYEKNNLSEDNEGSMEILGMDGPNMNPILPGSFVGIGTGNQHGTKSVDVTPDPSQGLTSNKSRGHEEKLFSFYRSQNGRLKLRFQDYIHSLERRTAKGTEYWRCCNRKICKARIVRRNNQVRATVHHNSDCPKTF